MLGARAKGDQGPIRFQEKFIPRGEVRRLAQLDSGSALGGLKILFSRSPRLDKLTREELQALKAEVQRDLGQVKGWKQEYEAERAGLMAEPRLEAPRYPAIALPSREEILRSLHESQPLRKAPFVDPLAKPAPPSPATPAAPPLRSALRAPGAASTGKRVTFAGDPSPLGARPSATPEERAVLGADIERPANPLAKHFERHPVQADDGAEWAHLRFRLGRLRDEA